jgi:hypothetical protein
MLPEKLLRLLEVLDTHMLRHKSSERINNRTVPNLAVVLAICGVPFITVYFEKSLCKQLRPDLVVICCSR